MSKKTFTCILRYGQFTHCITELEANEFIRYPKPIGNIGLVSDDKGEVDVSKVTPKILEFRYRKQLAEDVIEYVYEREL